MVFQGRAFDANFWRVGEAAQMATMEW